MILNEINVSDTSANYSSDESFVESLGILTTDVSNNPDLMEEDKEDHFNHPINCDLLYSFKESNCGDKFVTTSHAKLYNKNELHKSDNLVLPYEYLVREIILHGVPDNYYMLQLNGTNILTGIKIKTNEGNLCDYSFKITTKIIEKMRTIFKLDNFSEVIKNNCLNTTRIDRIIITTPNNIIFDKDYLYIEYRGYKYDRINKLFMTEEETTIYKHYISHYIITNILNNLTESIDIWCQLSPPCSEGLLLFYLEGQLVKKIVVRNSDEKKNNYVIKRIMCKEFNSFILEKDCKEDCMDIILYKNSLNFGLLGSSILVCVNVSLCKLNNVYYRIYSYPYMLNMFSD